MPSFLDLAETHAELGALLERHLEHVVLGEVAEARATWGEFVTLLRGHAAAEDEILTPLFVARGLETTGCTEELLAAEHRKVGREVEAGDRRCAEAPDQLDAAARLAWIRATRMLTEVLFHHDQRERAGFFPALDAAIAGDERAELIAAFRARERAGS